MGTSALIEYVCTAHLMSDGVGPKVTRVDGAWAFCAGHGEDAHEWTRIDPKRREFIGDVSQFRGAAGSSNIGASAPRDGLD
jgi:hypothetical protein